jgi:imidazolonepropionase-like amidohydrolase
MNALRRFFVIPLAALALGLSLRAGPAAETHAYRAARVWTGTGPAVTDGVLLVRDGKVEAVGRRSDVNIPAEAVVHDLGDAVVIPGLVVAETSLAEKGRDDVHALTPHHRAIDGFDPYADYSAALSGGVTTVQLAPGGGKRLMPGQGAVVKLAGDDLARRTLRDAESLRIVLGETFKKPPRVYEPPVGAVSVDKPLEPTRPQLADSLPGALAGLRATFEAAKAAPDSDPLLRAVATHVAAGKPVRVTAPGPADVQAALALARDYDLQLILVDVGNLGPFRDRLGEWKGRVTGIVLNPGVRPGTTTDAAGSAEGEAQRPPAETARDLRAAGLRVALKPVNDADLKETLFLGGLFTSHNSAADVLRMLTADAAGLLGVADRVGTLAPGKDADFVVLSGDPFALHTRVRSVYVDGKPVHEAKKGGKAKVVRAGRILTGTGEVIANGAVLVEGRSVRGVGRDVSAPADTEERRYDRGVIVPGFLDLGTGLGLGGPLTTAVPLTTRLGERLVHGDPAVALARQGGVTTALLSANSPQPGPVLAFKLGDKPRPLADPVAIRFAVRGNLTAAGPQLRDTLRLGKAYADAWTKYQADLAEYEKKKKEFEAAKAKAGDKKPEEPKAPEKPQTAEALEPYRALFAGRLPALVEARREGEIRLAVTVCRDEFNLRTVLIGADDAYRLAGLLADKHVSVATGPELVRTVGREEVNLPLALAVRGVPLGFQSQATSGARHLPLAVSNAVRHGLGADDALRGLTAGPAKFLGLEGAVGALAVGTDADLVVLSGAPFELSTRVLAVMIDGEWVYHDGDGR